MREFKGLILSHLTSLASNNQIYDSQYEFDKWNKRYQELIQKHDLSNQVSDLIAKKVKQSNKRHADQNDEISPEKADNMLAYKSPGKKADTLKATYLSP